MVSSLKANYNNFKIFVLCVNDIVWHILNRINIAEVTPIMLKGLKARCWIKPGKKDPFRPFAGL